MKLSGKSIMTGELTNLMSVDVNKIQVAMANINEVCNVQHFFL